MRYTIDPHARITPEHPDGRILTNARGDTLYTTNPTGAWIWERLSEGLDTQQIVAQLAARCGLPRARVEREVLAFVRELEARSLIRPVPGRSS